MKMSFLSKDNILSIMRTCQKVPNLTFKSIFFVKNHRNVSDFFSIDNINLFFVCGTILSLQFLNHFIFKYNAWLATMYVYLQDTIITYVHTRKKWCKWKVWLSFAFTFAGTSIRICRYYHQNLLQVIPSDLEGKNSIFFRRSFFP